MVMRSFLKQHEAQQATILSLLPIRTAVAHPFLYASHLPSGTCALAGQVGTGVRSVQHKDLSEAAGNPRWPGNSLDWDEVMDEVREDYLNSLEDLTCNAKPIITHLTIIAQENSHAASAIVSAIEERLHAVSPDLKLPTLYLLDSIIKNVGEPYISAFSKNLTRNFLVTYAVVDGPTRYAFERVLKTWPQLFSALKLQEIECGVDRLKAQEQERSERLRNLQLERESNQRSQQSMMYKNAYLNQKYNQTATPSTWQTSTASTPAIPTSGHVQQRRHAPLRSSHLLPLLQAYASLLQWEWQRSPQNIALGQTCVAIQQVIASLRAGGPTVDDHVKATLLQLVLGLSSMLPQPATIALLQTLTASANSPGDQPLLGPPLRPSAAPERLAFTTAQPTQGSASLSGLLANLLSSVPIATPAPTESSRPKYTAVPSIPHSSAGSSSASSALEPANKPNRAADLGFIELKGAGLLKKNYGAIHLLYEGLPSQCQQCGRRFPEGSAIVDEHMDWHFRQNRKLKDPSKRLISRDWYPSWTCLSASAASKSLESNRGEDENQQGADFFQASTGSKKRRRSEDEQYHHIMVLAPLGTTNCGVCLEKMDKGWVEDVEEWMLKGAMIGEDGKYYHIACVPEAIRQKVLEENAETKGDDAQANAKRARAK